MSDLINYKCKACGGNLKFNSKKQKIICTYCAKEYEAHEFESLPTDDVKNNLRKKKIDWEKTSYSYKYALLPVWILNTKWQNKNYIFAMNGQTGKLVGNLPVSRKKINIFFGAFLL